MSAGQQGRARREALIIKPRHLGTVGSRDGDQVLGHPPTLNFTCRGNLVTYTIMRRPSPAP